jgi:DNA-binding XRE family transcriptional regulator
MMNGAEFKAWRLEHGYTQQAIAEDLEVTRQTVVAWEKSAKLPRLLTLALEGLENSRKVVGKRATAAEARKMRAIYDNET